MTAPATAAVIGGGAVGTATALELAHRGTDVTLFEADEIAAGSSGRAAGVCYDAFGNRVDAELGRRSMAAFRERGALVECPYVWLARDGDDRNAEAVSESVDRMRNRGLDVASIGSDALTARFPVLETGDVARAAVAENAGYVDTAAYTRETARLAAEAGVEIREDEAIGIGDRPADAVVVAAGAHTARLCEAAGIPVPIKPYRVQALLTRATPLSDRAPMLYDATGGYYVRPREGGLFVGDGTEPLERDPDDWNRDADDWFRERCAEYLETAIGGTVPERRAWAGLCTATPDGRPLVGERAPGIYVAAGFQGHGFMRSPATAERLAAAICDGRGIDAFDPRRFDGDESFEIVEGMALD